MRQYYVYILANRSKMLYVGVTNDLRRRVYEHRHKLIEGYTRQYNITQLVYFETTPDVRTAITREKTLKGWRRSRKLALIQQANPEWRDLSAEWS
jgi:putative endonuclease